MDWTQLALLRNLARMSLGYMEWGLWFKQFQIMLFEFNSVLHYLRAESTATRPVTDIAHIIHNNYISNNNVSGK
jgi:hypothetical protein